MKIRPSSALQNNYTAISELAEALFHTYEEG